MRMRRRRRAEEDLFRCFFDSQKTDRKMCTARESMPRHHADANIACSKHNSSKSNCLFAQLLVITTIVILCSLSAGSSATSTPNSALKFDPETNSYSGLTFTFDPRLGKRVELLHFEHWLSIVQQSSALLYETLNGRAHLAEVRVLIPYKWRQFEWPVLHKPGSPIIANRRLRYADSDIVVSSEDPVYKETPFAVQHDECSKQGLHIVMPISFLEPKQQSSASTGQHLDVRLKARQLVREFASHRFGIFKESGFRNDFMYPPFVSLAGFGSGSPNSSGPRSRLAANRSLLAQAQPTAIVLDNVDLAANRTGGDNVRGFDQNWNECTFDTAPGSGLPTGKSAACLPYLAATVAPGSEQQQANNIAQQYHSFNLMSTDPFSYADLAAINKLPASGSQPIEWRDLADSARWHFCGDNFPPATSSPGLGGSTNNSPIQTPTNNELATGREAPGEAARWQRQSFAHNQLAANKQNVMCQERSAMEVIRASEDFRRTPFSPSNFNRLPATAFKFFQEMPPRLILCVEYAAHLYQSRRLAHGILEAAIAKFLAYDLIADTELALVLFGQHQSTRNTFKRLDSSTDSRLTLYNPPIDPFDEPIRFYSEQELTNLDIHLQGSANEQKLLVKGSCSFAKAISEAVGLQQQRSQYDDVGADIVMVTSGLFVEDEPKIEEIIKNYYQRPDSAELNIIIYPSNMLFDTKSRDGSVILEAAESDIIVKSRLAKLLLIQRLTGAKVHLVKEHLDANGDVKMSTLVQFYQIFEHIARGHSWDQTHSMALLSQQTVETERRQVAPSSSASGKLALSFQFELDSSIQNELIVAFIDPKQHQPRSSGKRFAIRHLQLRSPGGALLLADSDRHLEAGGASNWSSGDSNGGDDSSSAGVELYSLANQPAEAALFPYRSQLGLAGFHLKANHLNGTRSLAGRWTLSAYSDEPLQTSALAMARVNPAGDTLTARCWIQTYYTDSVLAHQQQQQQQHGDSPQQAQASSPGGQQLKQVKVFVQTQSGLQVGAAQEVLARMEVQDELGNIVQNVNMLDDGLGQPDMTRGDGLHSQYVQRATRPGYYKVTVELGGAGSGQQHDGVAQRGQAAVGQDSACCGSFVPRAQQQQQHDTRYLSRQLYCGTFFAEPNNLLGAQRPPRIANLTVANVDQDNRRVTLRWFEPQVDISAPLRQPSQEPSNELAGEPSSSASAETMGEPMALAARPARNSRATARHPAHDEEADEDRKELDMVFDSIGVGSDRQRQGAKGLVLGAKPEYVQPARYEIKMFTDRDAIKRAFDAKQEVGFRFNQFNSLGAFPNASLFGGPKEVTLQIPNGREGVYYVAIKVFNGAGVGSHLSTIVSFWIRNNLTLEEAEAIYGNSMTSVDADGNVYDRNGERIGGNQLNYSLLRGTSSLDGISILVFICVLAFILSIVCISLVACLASSARKSFGKARDHLDRKAAQSAIIGSQAGSGSSMVSGCGSSQQSEVASSEASGSQVDSGAGHDVELNVDKSNTISYNHLQQQQHYQQQQAQLIQAQHKLANQNRGGLYGEQQKYEQQQYSDAIYQRQMLGSLNTSDNFKSGPNQAPWPPTTGTITPGANTIMPQHTLVNGYAYATVNSHLVGQSDGLTEMSPIEGSLNQNGLGVAMSPVQSWPADLLISHYDKVKQARERNEAPPVMRIETLETNPSAYTDGLPAVAPDDMRAAEQTNQSFNQQVGSDQSYLVKQQRNQAPSYFNQQLQQQLSSVLRHKQRSTYLDNDELGKSSPALEGVTDHLSQEMDQSAGNNYVPLDSHQLSQIQPPPQYVYCADGVGQQQALLTEPSIYSQVTNLQQVTASGSDAYYANQWQATTNQAGSNGLASNTAPLYPSQQHYQQDYAQQAMDKCNSAISEV